MWILYAWIKQELLLKVRMKVEQVYPLSESISAETISDILASYMTNSDDKILLLRPFVKDFLQAKQNIKLPIPSPSPVIENGELWKWNPLGLSS